MARSIQLESVLNAPAAGALRDALLAARGQALTLDLSQVRHLGAQALQVILAARQDWHAAGHEFALVRPSADADLCLKAMGADAELTGELSR